MKNKNSIFILILGTFLVSIPHIGFAQKPKFSSSLNYIENLLADGNLREAVPYNRIVQKRIKKRLTENSPQYIQVFVNDAYFRTLSGLHEQVAADLETIPGRISNVLGDSGKVAFTVILRGVDTYHELGNYVGAKSLLELADKILSNSKFVPTDNDKIAFTYRKAFNLNQRGFYSSARYIVDSLIGVQQNRLTRSETAKDSKGNVITRNIKAKERRYRKYQFAELLLLDAKSLLDQGDYRKCYAKVRENNSWIAENLGKQNQYFARNNNLQGYINDAYGEYNESPKYFKKSLQKYQEWDRTNILTSLSSAYSFAKARKFISSEQELNRADFKINAKYGRLNVYKLEWELVNYSKNFDLIPNRFNERRLRMLQREYYSLAPIDPLKIRFLESYVEIYKRFNRIADAEDSLKKALEVKKALYGEDSPEYHALRLKLGDFYFAYTNDFPKIEDIYRSSFTDVVAKYRVKSHKDYVGQLTSLAKYYELLDKFDLALKYAQDAAETEKNNSGELSAKYATSLGYLARILTKYGNVQQAQEILSSSVQILKKNKPVSDEDKLKYAETFESIADVYNILGLYPDAQTCLKLATKYTNRVRNSDLVVNNTEELASFYIQTGLYENAKDLLTETIRQKEKSSKNYKREIISPLNQLGELYLIQGEYGLAEKNIRKSMAISSEVFGDSSVRYIQSLKNLVKLYSAIGDNAKAIENSSTALSLSKLRYGPNHIEVAKELNDYALIKYNSKQNVTEIESNRSEPTLC
jgi:hypothetical protein